MGNTGQDHIKPTSSSEGHGDSTVRARRRIWLVMLLSLVLGVIVVGGVFVYRLREEGRKAACRHNLQKIGSALRNYHDRYGDFPSAYLCDKAGKPVNSRRTLVMPDFWYSLRPGSYHTGGAPGYEYDEPWDGPTNAKRFSLDTVRCWPFQCPSAVDREEPAITNYVAVVGPNTMWPGVEPAVQAADGSDRDKILVIEVIHSDILWMEPRDLTLEQALDAIQPRKGMGIGSHHSGEILYVTVGGEVRTLDPEIGREELRKLLVRTGNGVQPPPSAELEEWGLNTANK